MANPFNPNDGYADYTDEQLQQLPGAPKRGAQGGYVYGWRSDPYQDILGDNDVTQQQQLQAFRQQGGVAADDTGALAQMSGKAPLQNASPAQQWNSQPAPAAPQGSGDLFAQLMQRAQQPIAADRNDPVIRAQADAYSANQQRGARNTIADLAESQGPLANLGAETRLANERAAQASGGFEAELLGRETAARREEIQQALSLWGGLLSDQQRQALQRELSYLSSSNQAADRAQQNDQFMRELALREAGQNNAFDYQWATLGL